MNVLFCVPYVPTSIRTRPYNLVRGLRSRGHDVTLATLWQTHDEREQFDAFGRQGVCIVKARLNAARSAWNCLCALPTALPLQSVYCWQPELFRLLSLELQDSSSKFDIVHVEHLRGARYGMALKSLSILHPSSFIPPMVWDSVDCISYLFEQAAHNSRSGFGRLVTRFELPRTKNHEAWLVNQFDRVLVTSPIDRRALEALGSQSAARNSQLQNRRSLSTDHCSPITVLPNGVDLDYFSPSDALRESATIVFSGKMSYHANVTAALHLVHDIMPHVWKERPNVHVQIVGQDPPSQVRKLAGTQRQSESGGSPLVTVTGLVPDLRPFLQRATLAVAPMLYGAGIQNKVLEAMACATPVVATSQAVSALQACSGEHLLVADEPAEFAWQILRLIDDRDLQRRIGQAGRQYVEQQHDWDRIVARLEQIYCELVVESSSRIAMQSPSPAVLSSSARVIV